MSRAPSLPLVAAVLAATLLASAGVASAQIYISGGFNPSTYSPSALNRLYDDGLHNDGAAGDGEFGVDIVSTQPAGAYAWSVAGLTIIDELWPVWPEYPPANAMVFTSSVGEVIHFRYFESGHAGWQPFGPLGACDQAIPAGASLVLEYGSFWPNERTAVPMTWNGTTWECVATIPTSGAWSYQFRCVGGATPGNWVRFTRYYNYGGWQADERPFQFTAQNDQTDVRFQFDPRTGQARAVELGSTPTRPSTWGRLKALYR